MSDERYPLHWPTGWPRTPPLKREKAKFEVSFAKARDELLDELMRLGSGGVVISSNIPVKRDGLPYASYKEPSDPGVAVYFRVGKKSTVLACDRWLWVRDNLRAISLHIEAMRGINRWGVGSVEQAFMGYQSLPASLQEWWQILEVLPDDPLPTIKAAYRQKALKFHPDTGGNVERMAAINRAWSEAQSFKSRL